MKISELDYPAPVLAENRNDYIECSFVIYPHIDEISSKTDIVISVDYKIVCDGLKDMISAGLAKVVVVIQSSMTAYRRLHEFEKDRTKQLIKIPKSNVMKNVEITGYIVANKDIDSFTLKEHNQEYFEGLTFSIRKGDVLAQEIGYFLYIDDSELEKPISSIFNVSKIEELETPIIPSYEDEKIEIQMDSKTFDSYYQLRELNNGTLRRYLSGVVILPALTEAIDKIIGNMQCGEEDYDYRMSGRRWYRAIEKQSLALGVNLNEYQGSSFSLANKLLDGIVYDAFAGLKNILDEEMDGHDFQQLGGED